MQDIGGRMGSVEENLVKAEDVHVRQLIRISDLRRESQTLTAGMYVVLFLAMFWLAGRVTQHGD